MGISLEHMTNSMILGWPFNNLKHGEFARNIRAFCDGDNEVLKQRITPI